MFVAQMLEGTTAIFAGLTFVFILLSTFAFNAAGGFLRPSGYFIFFNAMLTCIVGLTYKVFLGEPGQSYLLAPNVSMAAYCLGMFTMALVAALVSKLVPDRGLLTGMAVTDTMKKGAIGCLLLGVTISSFTYISLENGVLSAIRQINYFVQMAIILGTFYEVKKTGGRRSSNWVVWTAGIFIFVEGGFLGFSKQGFLTSGASWLAAAIAAGHNFGRKQILGMFAAAILFQMYLVPYSQVGRNLREAEPTMASDAKLALLLVPHLSQIRQQYLQDQSQQVSETSIRLYEKPQGFMDRMNMLAPDDALIAYTDQGNVEGLEPMYFSFLNIIPHFIWKDKPFYYVGNVYAREIGMIAEDNESTGVSFSPVGDAYHEATWFGVLLLTPTVVFILFFVMSSLSGDIRESPWGLLFCVLVAHSAPEGALGGQIYIATYGALGIVIVALLTKYVLPVVTGVIINTDRTRVLKTASFKPNLPPNSLSRPRQP
jgi:hypothetical protein